MATPDAEEIGIGCRVSLPIAAGTFNTCAECVAPTSEKTPPNLWPKLAVYFRMEVGPRQHIKLAEMMRDKAPLWDRIVIEHNLQPIPNHFVFLSRL